MLVAEEKQKNNENEAEEKVAQLTVENMEIKKSLTMAKEILKSTEASLYLAKQELDRKEEQLLLNITMAKYEIAEYKER